MMPGSCAASAKLRVWVHAVSVGEVDVARKVMLELRRRLPDVRFILSTTTSTGHAQAAKWMAPEDVLIYFPVDFPPVIRRVLSLIRPRILILTEGEIWPNMIRRVHGRNIPIAIINGRLSERSFRGYRRAGAFIRRPLDMIDLFCMQSDGDADRLRALGVDPARLRILGSAKYDGAAPDAAARARAETLLHRAGFIPGGRILLGGSTWSGEEAILMDILTGCRASMPDVQLILVPRHAERAGEVVAELEKRRMPYIRRSAMTEGAAVPAPGAVLLIDTTGELRNMYTVADVIFVGKSLTQHGGQNIIEPAACGKPVVVGPNMENFTAVMRDFLDADAILQVRDKGELAACIGQLLVDHPRAADVGRKAAEVVARNQGAVVANVEAVLPLIPPCGREGGAGDGDTNP